MLNAKKLLTVILLSTLLMTAGFLHSGTVMAFSSEEEAEIGREIQRQLVKEYGKVDYRGAFGERLSELFESMVEVSDRKDLDYSLTVLKTDMVNAFAAPGGFVFITEGLLEFVNDSHELAVVIGHELGHISAHHVVRRIQVQFGLELLFEVLIDPQREHEKIFSEVIKFLISRGYDRHQELEADRYGLRYARKAGYDPEAFITFQERLVEEKNGPLFLEEMLGTHPPASLRIEEAEAYIQDQLRGLAVKQSPVKIFASELEAASVLAAEVEPLLSRLGDGLSMREPEYFENDLASDFSFWDQRQDVYERSVFLQKVQDDLFCGAEIEDVEHQLFPIPEEPERAWARLFAEVVGEKGVHHLHFDLHLDRDKTYVSTDRFYPGRWRITDIRQVGGGSTLRRAVLGGKEELKGEVREKDPEIATFARADGNVILKMEWELEYERPISDLVEIKWFKPNGLLFYKNSFYLDSGASPESREIRVSPGESDLYIMRETVFDHPGLWTVLIENNGTPVRLLNFEILESFRFRMEL